MGIHRGPNIVTDGLVYAVDASSTRSFNFFETAVEVLVIAGGGGGGVGSNGGGGGGAGGFVYNPSYSLSGLTSVSVTIGAGGAGSTGRGSGANGANSVFGTITATGGGRGGGHPTGGGSTSPNTGGSGGGGSYSATGAAGVSGQGNTGGSGAQNLGTPTPNDGGGGGGGAGAVGVNAAGSGGPGGAGGAGKSFNISGTPIVYAGGGGGASNDSSTISSGGTGGGGTGGGNANPNKSGTNALANSGSGGGGGNGGGGNSGAGGSGVVIIRYVGKPKATGGAITSVGGYTIHTFTSSGTFSSSNLVYDIISNASGTLYNGVVYTTANYGTMEFDGSNDYMQADVSTTSLDGDPSFTADMFVKRRTGTNVGASNGFWGIGGVGQGNGISGWTPTQNLINLDVYDSTRLATSVTYPENEWIHLVWTKNGTGTETTNVKCYINGVETSLTKTRNATRANQFNTSTTGVCLGRISANASIYYSPINIATYKIYNRALTATEVLQNFNAYKNRFGL